MVNQANTNPAAAALLSGFDGRREFRGVLREARRSAAIDFDGNRIMLAWMITRVLTSRKLFQQIYDEAINTAAVDLLNSPRRNEIGDGEFLKRPRPRRPETPQKRWASIPCVNAQDATCMESLTLRPTETNVETRSLIEFADPVRNRV